MLWLCRKYHGNTQEKVINFQMKKGQRFKRGEFRVTYIIDHKMHYCFWNQVSDTLVDDGHVGVHEVADCLHLPLQLRIHGEVFRLAIFVIFILTEGGQNADSLIFSQNKINTKHQMMDEFLLRSVRTSQLSFF